MASPAATLPKAAHKPSALDTRWGKILIPSLSDFFFLAMIIWLFGVGQGWKTLLFDGDTGWHIRTGQYILQHGAVPYQDIFSFSKPGEPWFAWEWLTDVQYALVHARWGLGGVAVYSGLLICASAYTLLRVMLSRGANVFVSLVLTLLYIGGASLHYHARPHVWTLLLFAVAVGMLYRERANPSWAIWVLVPLVAVWTNLHGGFLAIIACTGLMAVGALLERWPDWKSSLRYFGLTAACLGASLLNPYGFKLHAHVYEYLRSEFIQEVVQEFQSPLFRSESTRQYEFVLLAAILCAGLLITRRRYVEVLWVGYFAHSSLTSARHIPLFLIVACPVVAEIGTELWNRYIANSPRKSIRHIFHQLSGDVSIGFRRATFWIVLATPLMVAAIPATLWPDDFAKTFPIRMVATHRERFNGARLFTSDQWGDYILYHLWPNQKVFVDGRSDFYGEKVGKDYLSLMNADFRWNEVEKKYGFDLMLLPVKWSLASVLKLSPEWRVIADDGTAILFERRQLAHSGQKNRVQRLMERNTAAESTRERTGK